MELRKRHAALLKAMKRIANLSRSRAAEALGPGAPLGSHGYMLATEFEHEARAAIAAADHRLSGGAQ